MSKQKTIDYQRIEAAIGYINLNLNQQPSLATIAKAVNLSPYHFQKMFSEWAGVSPKKFIQYMSLDYAKTLLNERHTLLETAHQIGLSGTSRLHDLFVSIEGMTPGEFKNQGEGLRINYSFGASPFGKIIIASTVKGICHLQFEEDNAAGIENLQRQFLKAEFQQQIDNHQLNTLSIFQKDWRQLDQIKLHLAGTPFQLKVWESLLRIPMGALASYGDIAENIDKPRSARAVGTAIGHNPIAFLIPCHRVIQSNGKLGGYRWGTDKKTAIIGWEAAKTEEFIA